MSKIEPQRPFCFQNSTKLCVSMCSNNGSDQKLEACSFWWIELRYWMVPDGWPAKCRYHHVCSNCQTESSCFALKWGGDVCTLNWALRVLLTGYKLTPWNKRTHSPIDVYSDPCNQPPFQRPFQHCCENSEVIAKFNRLPWCHKWKDLWIAPLLDIKAGDDVIP